MNLRKGKQGYITRRKRMFSIIVLIGVVCISTFLILSKVVPDPHKNIMIVMAILSVLPTANVLVSLIAIFKYKSVSTDEYEVAKETAGTGLFCAELNITGTKVPTVSLSYAYVHPNGIIAYTTDEKMDIKASEKYIESTLRVGGIDTNIKIFTDFGKYLDRCRALQSEHPIDIDTASDKLIKTLGNLQSISL